MEIGRRILVIDDDDVVRYVLENGLRTRGYQVFGSGTAADGIDQINKINGLELVILDYHLPDHSGLEIAEHIRQSTSDLPFFFLTSEDDESVAQLALKHGAQGYLIKPLNIVEISIQIESLLCNEKTRFNNGIAITKTIQQAVGIVMVERGLNSETAYKELQRYCRNANKKLIDVATDIVVTYNKSAEARYGVKIIASNLIGVIPQD